MAKVRYIFLALVTLLGFCSCERDGLDFNLNVGPFGNVPEESRKVMLMYEAGFNSLGGYMRTNIADLQEGYLPGKGRGQPGGPGKTAEDPGRLPIHSDRSGS